MREIGIGYCTTKPSNRLAKKMCNYELAVEMIDCLSSVI